MRPPILIRDYQVEDVQALANIYYTTIHQINSQHYTQEQVDTWAPKTSLQTEGWTKKFHRTKPIVATIEGVIVGFAEFELNGHIDCFYCHHEWIRKGIGSALMNEIFHRAHLHHISLLFVEVSITAKPFFEKMGFKVVKEDTFVSQGIGRIGFRMKRTI